MPPASVKEPTGVPVAFLACTKAPSSAIPAAMELSTSKLAFPACRAVALFAKVTEMPGIRGVILLTVLSEPSSIRVCQDMVINLRKDASMYPVLPGFEPVTGTTLRLAVTVRLAIGTGNKRDGKHHLC